MSSLVVNYLRYVGLTILYYDHLVSLPDEIKYIWSQPRSVGSLWFFANRYINVFGNVGITVMRSFANTEQRCQTYSLIRQLFVFATQFLIAVVSIIRTYALYGHSKKILVFLSVVNLCLFGGSLYVWFGHNGTPLVTGDRDCVRVFSDGIAWRIALPWWANFTIDALVFALTLYWTWSTTRATGFRTHDLVYILWRDGAAYFGVMGLAYLANIATFYFATPIVKGSLAGAASAIAVSMASRMLLNLRRFVDHATSRPLQSLPVTDPSSPRLPDSVGRQPLRRREAHSELVFAAPGLTVGSVNSEWDRRRDWVEMARIEREH